MIDERECMILDCLYMCVCAHSDKEEIDFSAVRGNKFAVILRTDRSLTAKLLSLLRQVFVSVSVLSVSFYNALPVGTPHT